MKLFIGVCYGVIVVLFVASVIYSNKNIEIEKTKKFSRVLFVFAFLSIVATSYFSITCILNIRNMELQIEKFTKTVVWRRYVVEQNIVIEKGLIIKYVIIGALILICHLQHIRLLKLKHGKDTKDIIM